MAVFVLMSPDSLFYRTGSSLFFQLQAVSLLFSSICSAFSCLRGTGIFVLLVVIYSSTGVGVGIKSVSSFYFRL